MRVPQINRGWKNGEHTVDNSNAAESRIWDADMAKEVVEHTKHTILEQAGESILAQANQNQQRVLDLLS